MSDRSIETSKWRGQKMWAGAALAAVLLVAGGQAASAQIRKDAARFLSQAEATKALMGIDMRGNTPSFGFSWRECITPKGETLYQVGDRLQRGRLRISEDGWACFAYSETNYTQESCFTVRRNGDGLVFNGEEGSVFVTTRVDRGVKSCEPEDERIS